MKIGEEVMLCDESGSEIQGKVVEIVIRVEDDQGEIWEIPIDEALVPDLEEECDHEGCDHEHGECCEHDDDDECCDHDHDEEEPEEEEK